MTDADTVSADDLRAWLARGERVAVVDVRDAEDRAEWSVPGSLHVDAHDALAEGDLGPLAALDLPRDRPVVTVCNAGRMSLVAARLLRDRGVDARSLAGGMRAWSLAWNEAEVPLSGSEARLVQVRRTGKGCLSYVIGARGEAVVVDASVDPQIYLDVAERRGWRVTRVLDTHVHADHVSRSRRLAELAGATLHLPETNRVRAPFAPVRDGDALVVGGARVTALRVPGHTEESTCFLVDGRALLTGDTLFLDSVGRPDLEASPEAARERARLLHASLARLLTLPSDVVVLPGHASEPVAFDGRALAAPLAVVRERVRVAARPAEEFVEWILARLPPTPPNHRAIVALNEAGEMPQARLPELEAGANRCAIR